MIDLNGISLCFELKTVEKYIYVLKREFSKRLETKATWKKRCGCMLGESKTYVLVLIGLGLHTL